MNKEIKQMSIASILGNVFLSIFKLIAGIIGNSNSMISDAVHSLSDVFTTFIALIGTKISSKEADIKHPYGHERLECVASIILSVLLLLTGFGIGYKAVGDMISGAEVKTPGIITIVAAIASIVVKEAMFWYTRYYAKKIKSSVFMADAWHHRTDALSSVGALIGIVGTRLGVLQMDNIASIIISAFIIFISVKIFIEAINKMVDKACPKELENEIVNFIESQPDVIRVDLIQTRMFSEKIYVDLEIGLEASMSLHDSHTIAENVHEALEEKYPDIKHVMIHVNPVE